MESDVLFRWRGGKPALDRQIGRSLSSQEALSEAICICQNGSISQHGHVGTVVHSVSNDQIVAECRLPFHDANGAFVDSEPCTIFDALPR